MNGMSIELNEIKDKQDINVIKYYSQRIISDGSKNN